MAHVSDIKLIRTDTTLDLSQKAEKGMLENGSLVVLLRLYFVPTVSYLVDSLFELDRDTLHTRLGSAHECHSGVRLVLSRWCRSCQLDLLSTDQLVWIEPDSRNGAGTGVFTVPGRVPAAASSADQDRGKGVASYSPTRQSELEAFPYCRYFDASYTGEIPLYTADLSACPGNESSGT
uniref:Uncharacterized protein n=1 Tax=Ananas comosus var. bracteatus TaxID=296719 RepID=A0A6V7QHP4_ANACO|nr:unnamed protein product [Ananas comosus var. bracteatus]